MTNLIMENLKKQYKEQLASYTEFRRIMDDMDRKTASMVLSSFLQWFGMQEFQGSPNCCPTMPDSYEDRIGMLWLCLVQGKLNLGQYFEEQNYVEEQEKEDVSE